MTTTIGLSFAALTIDSADPAALADFWGKALGRPVSPGAIAGDTAVDATGPEAGPRMILHHPPEPGTAKNSGNPRTRTRWPRWERGLDDISQRGREYRRRLRRPPYLRHRSGGWPADHRAEERPRNGVGLRLEDDIGVYREVWAGAPPGCVSRRARIRLTRQLPELFLCERAAGPSVTAITQSG